MRITGAHISIGFLAVITAAGLFFQRQANDELRTEIALLRGESGKLRQLHLEHERLVTAQLPLATLESLRADHAAVERLRGEVELMRNRVKQMEGR